MTLARKQIAVAFVLGIIAGFVVAWCGGPYLLHKRWKGRQSQERLLQRLTTKLQLTATQRSQVSAILESKRQKMDALHTDIRSRFEDIRSSTSAEIRQLLTPEQHTRFNIMEAEWAAHRKRFHDHWMRPAGAG